MSDFGEDRYVRDVAYEGADFFEVSDGKGMADRGTHGKMPMDNSWLFQHKCCGM